MTSALIRRMVTASLPIAALSAASSKGIAASCKPDAELLRLGAAFSDVWSKQAALEAELNRTPPLIDDDLRWNGFDRLYSEASSIVDQIEALPATTLAGLVVKARACHWCHAGEPVDERFFAIDGKPTTDMRLAAGILSDLVAMGGANV